MADGSEQDDSGEDENDVEMAGSEDSELEDDLNGRK